MQRKSIETIIIDRLAIAGGLNAEEISIDSKVEDLAIDSISMVDFAVGLEDAFNIEIECLDPVEIEALTDVRDLVIAKLEEQVPVAA